MSIKTLKNGPQKLLIIGPDPFISQSSSANSPQPRIDFSYYEISGPDICSLICGYRPYVGESISRFSQRLQNLDWVMIETVLNLMKPVMKINCISLAAIHSFEFLNLFFFQAVIFGSIYSAQFKYEEISSIC